MNPNVTATLTLAGVNIGGLASGESPLLLGAGSTVTVTLQDGSTNTLTAGENCAGIQTSDAELTIDGTGDLIANGGRFGAGIGGGGGQITIGGNANVSVSGGVGAGIGGGASGWNPDPNVDVGGDGGTIDIGGNAIVNATSTTGAAIGGGEDGSGGQISISGNVIVNASNEGIGAAIGGGYDAGAGGDITINGSTVKAISTQAGMPAIGHVPGVNNSLSIDVNSSFMSLEAIAGDGSTPALVVDNVIVTGQYDYWINSTNTAQGAVKATTAYADADNATYKYTKFTQPSPPAVTFTTQSTINLAAPTDLVFAADVPGLLAGASFEGVAFSFDLPGSQFGQILTAAQGLRWENGAVTIPKEAFAGHGQQPGNSPLPAGAYRAQILFTNHSGGAYAYIVGSFTLASELVVYAVLPAFEPFDGSGTRTATVQAPFTEFTGLARGGQTLVRDVDYTLAEGSTIITLQESYLKTPTNGSHTFRASFTNGYANLVLAVNVTQPQPQQPTPEAHHRRPHPPAHKQATAATQAFGWRCWRWAGRAVQACCYGAGGTRQHSRVLFAAPFHGVSHIMKAATKTFLKFLSQPWLFVEG